MVLSGNRHMVQIYRPKTMQPCRPQRPPVLAAPHVTYRILLLPNSRHSTPCLCQIALLQTELKEQQAQTEALPTQPQECSYSTSYEPPKHQTMEVGHTALGPTRRSKCYHRSMQVHQAT